MSNPDKITHSGTIINVAGDMVKVNIVSASACSACHAKGACSVSDAEDKIIDVKKVDGKIYEVGEQVVVILDKNSGLKAVMLGYIIPFLVLLTVLITGTWVGLAEGVAGLISIGSLAPYYLLVYLTREKQKKIFDFKLKS